MGAFEPVIRGVAEQARQAGELLDDIVNEATICVRNTDRLTSQTASAPAAILFPRCLFQSGMTVLFQNILQGREQPVK